MSKIKKFIIAVSLIIFVFGAGLYYYASTYNTNFFNFKYIKSYWKNNNNNNTGTEQNNTIKDNTNNTEKPKEPEKKVKTIEQKQAVMKADMPTMNSLGLYYDYANMTLYKHIQKNTG